MKLLDRLLTPLDTCVMCGGEIPAQRRGFTVNVCSDICDANEQAERPF